MDTDLLKAFVMVAEENSFSVAAEKLHLTQSAISKRIALLEEQLSCKLFDRIPRSISLTEAGNILLPRANQILQQLNDTQQIIDDLSMGVSGSLRLAISHHIGLHRIPTILKQYVATYPHVNIDVDFMDSEVAYENILQGKFDLAVITLAPEDPSSIISHKVWDDPMDLVVYPGHPLISRKNVTFQDLSQFPAILPGMNTYTGQMIQQRFIGSGYKLNASMATNYLETIKMMVSVGLGWSLLPESMIDDNLKSLPCPSLKLIRQLGFIHHREKTLSQATLKFIELLTPHLDQPANTN